MLILNRKVGETIWIDENIEIVITEIKGEQVKVGIRAPRNIEVIRGELRQDIMIANTESIISDMNLIIKKNN